MTAPKFSLVLFSLLLLVPLLTLAGLRPELWVVALLAVCFCCLVPILDLVTAFGRHKNLEIVLPPLLRATLGHTFDLPLTIRNLDRRTGTIRIAASYPAFLRPNNPILKLSLDPAIIERTFGIQLVGLARGKNIITDIYFEWNSSLRFWTFRERRGVNCQVQIFPDLAYEGRQLAKFLNRGAVGARTQRQIGRGREFERLRTYEPGDGFDAIHWKATAKHRYPITKVFQLERSQEVYLILDTSRLSGRSDGPSELERVRKPTHLDRAISAGLLFCLAAKKQGDLFGLITFSNKVDHFIRARSGTGHFNFCRNLATGLETKQVSPDYVDIFATLRQRVRRRSLMVFLTALDDPVLAEEFTASAELLTKSHILLVIMISPPGLQPLFDQDIPESTEQIYERLAGHIRWTNLCSLEKALRQKRINFHMVANEQLALKTVGFYMDLKRRQLL